jgi:hypothetical protein
MEGHPLGLAGEAEERSGCGVLDGAEEGVGGMGAGKAEAGAEFGGARVGGAGEDEEGSCI